MWTTPWCLLCQFENLSSAQFAGKPTLKFALLVVYAGGVRFLRKSQKSSQIETKLHDKLLPQQEYNFSSDSAYYNQIDQFVVRSQ